jgi:hypothetical protein
MIYKNKKAHNHHITINFFFFLEKKKTMKSTSTNLTSFCGTSHYNDGKAHQLK